MGQQSNKYHISDEGIIYRVNEDGSFTQLGDIVGLINNANENNSVSPKKASSRKRIMPYVIIIICALTLGLYLFSPTGEKDSELKAENARLYHQIDILIEENNYLRKRTEAIAKEIDKLNNRKKSLF